MSHPILIIEDTDWDFQSVERGLRKLDVENPIVRCTGVDDALDWLHGRGAHAVPPELQPPPVIILLDLRLEGGNGRDILEHVKQHEALKPIPIIVWSGSSDPRDVEISYRLGANSFVRKTFDFSEVNQTLERLTRFWLETAVLPPLADGTR